MASDAQKDSQVKQQVNTNGADLKEGRASYVFFIDREAKSFHRSLRKLGAPMRAAVETKLERLSENGLLPGDRIEKLWGLEKYDIFTLRMSGDLRLVFTRAGHAWKLFFLGHHDEAYRFAARNRDLMAAAG